MANRGRLAMAAIPPTSPSNGTYYGHELSAAPNYACCAPDESTNVTLDTTKDTIVLTLEDIRATGNVKVVNKDDAGTAMSGVTFTRTGTSNLATTTTAAFNVTAHP